MIDPSKYGQYIAKYGEEYAQANALADRAEEMKKIILATLMLRYEGSQSSREMHALASPEYDAHIGRMVDARCAANVAKAKFEAVRVDFEVYRTLEASRRQELKTMGG